MPGNEQFQDQKSSSDELSSALDDKTDDVCPHCGAVSGVFSIGSDAISSEPSSNLVSAEMKKVESVIEPALLGALASTTGSLPEKAGEGLSKWDQDTFRDIISNVNNTLRFQIQLAVPILAGCVTALNLVPPQEHQDFINNYDRWVFIPVLLSMGVAYYGLELHWGMAKDNKPTDNHEVLSKLIKKKYLMMHLAIFLQALGLILLFGFVLLEYK